MTGTGALAQVLDAYANACADAAELADVARIRAALERDDVYARSSALHVTASALIVHPQSQRVLLRWHPRMRQWMQVGGHFDPGETDPFAVARREAHEETGLVDLAPPPSGSTAPVQIVIVPVPEYGDEPAHEHADLRFVFVTDHPDATRPESRAAKLQWLPLVTAPTHVDEENLRAFLARAQLSLR
jgi:8-oxo-dGTP pyrophosphatase MutT (NUDIX family)